MMPKNQIPVDILDVSRCIYTKYYVTGLEVEWGGVMLHQEQIQCFLENG